MALSYIVQPNSIAVFNPSTGDTMSVYSDHPNFAEVRQIVMRGDLTADEEAKVFSLVEDSQKKVAATLASLDGLTVDATGISFNGELLDQRATRRIVELMGAGQNAEPLLRFLRKLLDNPKPGIFLELFDFMSKAGLPITAEGDFIAYKIVGPNYMDLYSGKFDNSIGQSPKMPASQVDDDRNRTCSRGLHVCSKKYLPYYGGSVGSDNRIMIVRVNPKDVMAIPTDYNHAKMRCTTYDVIGELNDKARTDIIEKQKLFRPVGVDGVTTFEEGHDDDDYDWGSAEYDGYSEQDDADDEAELNEALAPINDGKVYYVRDDWDDTVYYEAGPKDIAEARRGDAQLYAKDVNGDYFGVMAP